MEWLLILSALLNAATGPFMGTHGPDSAARQEATVEAVAVVESMAAVAISVSETAPVSAVRFAFSEFFPPTTDLTVSASTVETDRLIE